MSESTREWILKRRHEDPGEQRAHPGLSVNFTLADAFDQAGRARVFNSMGAAGPNAHRC